MGLRRTPGHRRALLKSRGRKGDGGAHGPRESLLPKVGLLVARREGDRCFLRRDAAIPARPITAAVVGGFAYALTVLTTVALTACDKTPAGDEPRFAAFEDIFRHVRSIELEEPEGDLANQIVEVTKIAVAVDGRIAVADGKSGRIRIFSDEDGALQASVGRFGAGPGGFRSTSAVAFDRAGRLFVADGSNGRITRYDPALQLDTIVRVPGYFAYQIQPITDDTLLLTIRRELDEWLAFATAGLEALRSVSLREAGREGAESRAEAAPLPPRRRAG